MKYLYPLILALLLSCGNKRQSQNKESFIPYYTLEVGNSGVKGYEHYIYIGTYNDTRDSVLIKHADDYTKHLKTEKPVAAIIFITDTTQFPRNYDVQHWDKIRDLYCMDIQYEFRSGWDNFQKMNEIGWWKDGKRYKSVLASSRRGFHKKSFKY